MEDKHEDTLDGGSTVGGGSGAEQNDFPESYLALIEVSMQKGRCFSQLSDASAWTPLVRGGGAELWRRDEALPDLQDICLQTLSSANAPYAASSGSSTAACSPAPHAEGPGFKPQWVHVQCRRNYSNGY